MSSFLAKPPLPKMTPFLARIETSDRGRRLRALPHRRVGNRDLDADHGAVIVEDDALDPVIQADLHAVASAQAW